MTNAGDQAMFAAALEEVGASALFAAAFCERRGVGPSDALRITLIVEELFLNIVTHGYGAATGGTIRFALALDGGDVVLACEDRAPAYDPRPTFDRSPDDLDAPLETRGVGGLGVWLIARYARVERYERADGANRLTLRIAREE